MLLLILLVVAVLPSEQSLTTLPLNRLTRFCQTVTGNPESECRRRRPPLQPICHGGRTYDIECSSTTVLSWELLAQVESVPVSAMDALCRQGGAHKSFCNLTTYTCTGSLRSCSPRSIKKNTSTGSSSTGTVAFRTRVVRNDAVSGQAYVRHDEVDDTHRAQSMNCDPGEMVTTTTPAPRTYTTATDLSDACGMHDAVLSHRSVRNGNSYFLPIRTLMRCLASLQISNADVLWTLHNMRFGIAETYSFTHIAKDSQSSEHANVCGHAVHDIRVDLEAEFSGQIARHQAILDLLEGDRVATDGYLSSTQPAYAFHVQMTNLMNRLHDAHTMYSMPFEMFKVFAPISFGSKMVPKRKKDGTIVSVQVVTLRMRTGERDDPFGTLEEMYRAVYHMDAQPEPIPGIGIPKEYNGREIVKINGVPALHFLRSLVEDNGPFAGSYTQAEQRLNAYIFSVPVLTFSPLRGPLPSFNSLTLTMKDGYAYTVMLMAQFVDLSTSPYHSKVPNLRSKEALQEYIHTSEAFSAWVRLDTNNKGDPNTLWQRASKAASKTFIEPYAPDDVEDVMNEAEVTQLAEDFKRQSRRLDPVDNALKDFTTPEKCQVPSVTVNPFAPSRSVSSKNMHRTNGEKTPNSMLTGTELVPKLLATKHIRAAADRSRHFEVQTPRSSRSDNNTPQCFSKLGSLEYLVRKDTMIVRVPSMNPEYGAVNFEMFPEMTAIQNRAKEHRVTRLLFDVAGNAGGLVMSAYALQWYVNPDPSVICAPLRKRITADAQVWLQSFGEGLDALLDKHMVPKGPSLVAHMDEIFEQVHDLTILIYNGLGLRPEQIGPTKQSGALARIELVKNEIERMGSDSEKAAAIVEYIRSRKFLPAKMPNYGADLLPLTGFEPFYPNEMKLVGGGSSPLMSHYHEPEEKKWGRNTSKYSQPTEYAFCRDKLMEMPSIAPHYDHTYWSQIAFVSDGTCGSACALFLQGIQLSGAAVGFSYGGRADTPIDVGSYAGGNVESYDEFWPKMTFGAKVGHLASLGETEWSRKHVNSWISTPGAFPTKARVKFNLNMMFAPMLGPHALPRQFYLIPARMHLNLWAATRAEKELVYDRIISFPSWNTLSVQFPSDCPA